MPIPQTRAELVDLVRTAYAKLRDEIEAADTTVGARLCVDDWSVKDVIAIRAWWTEAVVDWIEAGLRGQTPALPAEGYKWNETPRLNADVVADAASQDLARVRQRLDRAFERVLETIDALDDRALLDVGVFAWAGRWPVSRWISVNTARQYTTARAMIRKALR